MNFFQALCSTYDANLHRVGKEEVKILKDKQIQYMLLPISHTTQTAHIEVLVTLDGSFYDAYVIPKVTTVIPFTEASGIRSGKDARLKPHVLHDKLISVAGDFKQYTGENVEDSFNTYITQLHEWCESPYAHEHVQAIYKYLKKRSLIHDLVEKNVLHLGTDGLLMKKWTMSAEKPDIFKQISGDQSSAFVRFTVYEPGLLVKKVWINQEIFKSYQQFYKTKLNEKDLCYITGTYLPYTTQHPSKLRNSGDMSKLISSNDSAGFTFRGRFTKANQVATISYEVSQKAHNALKWLIEKQAKQIDGRVFLMWGMKDVDLDTPFDRSSRRFKAIANVEENTQFSMAQQYQKILDGYKVNLPSLEEKMFVATLDAATPGRLATLYFRTFDTRIYLKKLLDWHKEAEWQHSYYDYETKKQKRFVGAPTLETIAKLAYAPRANDKLVKGTIERLLPCILDGRHLPKDIVRSAIQRASNPVGFDALEWERILQVACSLIRKSNYEKGIEYTMTLNIDNTDRSYLFGRLLAVADQLERKVIFSNNGDSNRTTNALRYMNAFSTQPFRTWTTIHNSLQPYISRLGKNADYFLKIIGEITAKFEEGTFNNHSLDGNYLLGFYNQRQDFYNKKEKVEE